jgi:hypothetical protein
MFFSLLKKGHLNKKKPGTIGRYPARGCDESGP